MNFIAIDGRPIMITTEQQHVLIVLVLMTIQMPIDVTKEIHHAMMIIIIDLMTMCHIKLSSQTQIH